VIVCGLASRVASEVLQGQGAGCGARPTSSNTPSPYRQSEPRHGTARAFVLESTQPADRYAEQRRSTGA
jgi:hypothetical protein